MADFKTYKTPVFRVSFPHLLEPSKGGFDGAEPKYSVSAIWTPANFTDAEKALWKALLFATDEALKARFKKGLKDMKALMADGQNIKLVPRNGATKADLEGYGEGTYFANLSSKMKPGIVGPDAKTPVNAENGNTELVYPGVYARATVSIYTYDTKSKGVAWGLQNLMIVKDGERLDSRTNAAEDFDGDGMEDTENLLDNDGDEGDDLLD